MSSSKLNVLLILDSLGFGGNETAAYQLLSNIDRSIFKCFVLALNTDSKLLVDKLKKYDVEIISFSQTNILSLPFIIKYFLLIRNNRIYSVISYTYNYKIIFLQFISIILGVKNRIVRVSAMPLKFSFIKLFIIQFLSNLFLTNQIAVSNSVKDWLVQIGGYYKRRIIVINNGIEISFVKSNAKIIKDSVVMVSRMDESKDHRTLIRAMAIVQKHFPEVYLNLIGDGLRRNELSLLARELNCKTNFLGYLNNVYEVLPSFSIFVHSSFSEGFPNVILEAMVAKLPIIASDIPPNREILNNGEFGILFHVEDHILLSELIMNLLINKTEREAYSALSHIRVKNYSLEEMISQYQSILK
ncbi:MAG: hypothetical protein RLY43_2270 [Bacteroidota bacterium]|jgi:glycosyltransferase involved in cell wall biosynthesis